MSQVILSLSIVDFCGGFEDFITPILHYGSRGNPSSYISGKASIIQQGYFLLFANMLSCILIDIGLL